jgi:mannose-6-phosphate isomerase
VTARADYPLLLLPHLAERVWGGDALGAGIGEAWDLSVHENGPSTIGNGPLQGRTLADVAAESPDDFGGPIDLLAKRLDCARDLSVQVHPRTGDPKTEAWVVLDAQPGAGVYRGFEAPVQPEQVRAAAADGTLPKLLRFVEVPAGAAVFVPSGTVHAIGGGLFLFELQQSADTTYRLFDWGRDRPLHVEEALACTDLGAAPPDAQPETLPDGATRLVACEHFHIDRVETDATWRVAPGDRWTGLLVIEGTMRVGDDLEAGPGTTVMVPKAAGDVDVTPAGPTTVLRYGP